MDKRWMPVILLAWVLSACSSAVPTPTAIVAVTEAITVEPTPTNTVTASPLPPTETPTPTVIPSPSPTPPPADYGPDNFPADVNPLTGLPVSDPILLDRLPMAVKMQTFPRGQRPLWSISLADIVYDYYQNSGLTRLNAIFYGNDSEQVGPMRSARLFDDHIVRMYKLIFTFGGADRRILSVLLNNDYYNRLVLEGSNICPVMCRVDPDGYNFLVTNTKELNPYVAGRGVDTSRPDINGMTFQLQPPEGGVAGESLSVRYSISSYTRWDYDPVSGKYLRFQDTQEAGNEEEEAYAPFTDRDNDQQVSSANVVIIFTPHELAFGSVYGRSEIIDIKLSGSGKAVIFRDGQAYEVNWNRPIRDAPLFLTDKEGNMFPFKQGNTWFQVIGLNSRVEQREDDSWRFENRLP
jgi:hypothetical protein